MNEFVSLRRFRKEELILSDDETRVALKFIFRHSEHELIDSLPMSDSLRGFAQGLLVKAIDYSYAVGYVESMFRSVANPTAGGLKVLKKFGRKAAINWFKYATVHDLQNVKVYDFLRDRLAIGFRTKLRGFVADHVIEGRIGAFVALEKPEHMPLRVLG